MDKDADYEDKIHVGDYIFDVTGRVEHSSVGIVGVSTQVKQFVIKGSVYGVSSCLELVRIMKFQTLY